MSSRAGKAGWRNSLEDEEAEADTRWRQRPGDDTESGNAIRRASAGVHGQPAALSARSG